MLNTTMHNLYHEAHSWVLYYFVQMPYYTVATHEYDENTYNINSTFFFQYMIKHLKMINSGNYVLQNVIVIIG